MKLFFVFSLQCVGSRSKTITSHYNKALSVQQWQENCAFRQKTLYTLEMENGRRGRIFWLMSIRYTVHSDKWGETTRYTERKLKKEQHTHTRPAPWNINGICLLTSYNNQQLSLFRDFREREFVLDWQPLYTWGTCAWPASTNTEAHSYVYLWLEIMTGQEQGNPISHFIPTFIPTADTESNLCMHCSENIFII